MSRYKPATTEQLAKQRRQLDQRSKHITDPGNQVLQLGAYHARKLIDDIKEALDGVPYPSIDSFKSISSGVIKAYVRGLGLRATSENCRQVLEQLLTRAFKSNAADRGWCKRWCKRILDEEPEQSLTNDDQLNYENFATTAGISRPVYDVGKSIKITVPETPQHPLILSGHSNTTVFQGIDDLVEFVANLWDTVSHIERTFAFRNDPALSASYAYRSITDWEGMIRESMTSSGEDVPDS